MTAVKTSNGAIVALAIFCFVLAAPPVVNAARGETRQQDRMAELLERESLGFDLSTLTRMRDAGPVVSSVSREITAETRMLGITGSALVAFLLIAIGYALFGQRRFADRCESALAPLARNAPGDGERWASALAEIVAAGLPPLLLWALHAAIAAITQYRHPAFVLVGGLLLVWTEFAVAATAVRELLLRPLLPIPPEHGRYLYGIARWLLFYGILLAALLDAVASLGAPDDVVAFLRFVFRLSLIAFLALALAKKRAVMALFPDLPNRPYRSFVRGLDRAYAVALAFTVLTALLSLVGYTRLAGFLWIRTWALVGVFLGGVLLVHFLNGILGRWIERRGADPDATDAFRRSTARLVDYAGVLAVGIITLRLTGLREPIVGLLSAPMYSIGDRDVSLLLFVVAALIVIAFILFGRLLRDYLDFQVYPALNVEEGVAHAISTFVFYAFVVLGILSAIQAIGLGIGSLTVFAGALGVGLGFGLQTIAGNLASGLTLIFSRALRRGDWVTVGDTIGVIQEVGVRATRLRTRDAVEYLVPNQDFVSGTIVNWTHTSPFVRQHVPLGVSYGSDPERVRDILLGVARESPYVHDVPPPEVWFVGFGESSLDFELLVWANLKQVSEKQVRSDLYFRIFRAFKEASIEIPFPQREVTIRRMPPTGSQSPAGS